MISNQKDIRPSLKSKPFKPTQTILNQEIEQAVDEINRPTTGLFISGLLAGMGMGISVFLISVLLTLLEHVAMPVVQEILIANAYTVGFIIVILARTDLFTEYTTIAILPILTGQASIKALGRLWGLIYSANLLGSIVIALIISILGPALGVVNPAAFSTIARSLIEHSWWIILLSSLLAGWLMGMLSWLVTAARETTSQLLFIWLITGTIGFGHLHHVITGNIEMLVGVFAVPEISFRDYGYFLLWTTLGNVIGGFIFAVLIRYSFLITGSADNAGDAKTSQR
mgnify:CR=1 FL=1